MASVGLQRGWQLVSKPLFFPSSLFQSVQIGFPADRIEDMWGLFTDNLQAVDMMVVLI